jgi:ectoine hydroxylase-related dioxygenase (phytanoyl-CoA dioxygenase family)
LSPINKNTGATEFMLNSHLYEKFPDEDEFNSAKIVLDAAPGDVVYFDSRIWHRAGAPVTGVSERIIFTPIFSRPFIKPGFDYAAECRKYGEENVSEIIKQLSSCYSDIPKTHYEWYDWKNKRFYQKEQDL